MQPIYELLQMPDLIIKKLACEFIENLVTKCKDENLQEIFRKSGGLQEVLNILEVKINFFNTKNLIQIVFVFIWFETNLFTLINYRISLINQLFPTIMKILQNYKTIFRQKLFKIPQ